jgi:uncharacterized protein YceK
MNFIDAKRTSGQFRNFFISLILGLLLSGCTAVTSLQPPYEEKDVVTQPTLTGTWDEDKDQDIDGCRDAMEGLNVEALPVPASNSYALSMHDESKKGWVWKYDLNLVRLKDSLFVDVVFDNLTTIGGEQITSNDLPPIPTHLFARMWINGDHLRLTAPEAGPLEDIVGKKQAKAPLQKIDDYIILTRNTPEIRDFLTEYADQIFPKSDSCGFTRRQ